MGIFQASGSRMLKKLEKMKAKKDVKGLTKALKHNDDHVRQTAATYLGRIGDAMAVDALIDVLEDKDFFTRSSAAKALGKIGDTKAIEPLIRAVKDESSGIAIMAAPAVAELGELAVEPLIQILMEDDYKKWQMRRAAAHALGMIRDVRTIEPLIEALDDMQIWESAADALEEIGDKKAEEPLKKALTEALKKPLLYSGETARVILSKLEKMDWQPQNDTEKAYCLIAREKWDEVVELREAAVEPLIRALDATSTQKNAAKALGKIRDHRAVQPLVFLLANREPTVRQSAA